MIHNNLSRWMRRNGIMFIIFIVLALFFFSGFFLGRAGKKEPELMSDGLPAVITWGNVP